MTEPEPRTRGWQAELLRRVFLHQNGFAAVTALATLESTGALARLRKESVSLADCVGDTRSSCAMAASVVAACGAGWLTAREGEGRGSVISSATTPELTSALDILLDAHRAVRDEIRDADWSDESVIGRLLGCVGVVSAAKAAVRKRASMPDATAERLIRLLEGVIAVPLLPRVARGYDHATLAPLFAALELGEDEASMRRVLSFFAPMYGLAGSYAEALLGLPSGVATSGPLPPSDITRSIDRGLNVRASAAAHRGYFHAASGLIARLFDEVPLPQQPRAILDVGCGDGTWLRSLYEAIHRSTARGRCIRQYPLHLIGVDLDPVALEISSRNLRGLPATCIVGDVGEPGAIAAAITSASGVDIGDVLPIRAFVDHNRSLSNVEPSEPGMLRLAEGVYAACDGSVACARAVQRDWAAHYARWMQVCGRHGLVVIEAHTLNVPDVEKRLETSHSLALQYYHALSGQSPIPYASFRAAATSAGLDACDQALYPRAGTTTSVSRLVPRRAGRTKKPSAEGSTRLGADMVLPQARIDRQRRVGSSA